MHTVTGREQERQRFNAGRDEDNDLRSHAGGRATKDQDQGEGINMHAGEMLDHSSNQYRPCAGTKTGRGLMHARREREDMDEDVVMRGGRARERGEGGGRIGRLGVSMHAREVLRGGHYNEQQHFNARVRTGSITMREEARICGTLQWLEAVSGPADRIELWQGHFNTHQHYNAWLHCNGHSQRGRRADLHNQYNVVHFNASSRSSLGSLKCSYMDSSRSISSHREAAEGWDIQRMQKFGPLVGRR